MFEEEEWNRKWSRMRNEDCIQRDVSQLFSFDFPRRRKKWKRMDRFGGFEVRSGISALKLWSQRQLIHQREFLVGQIFRMEKVGETIV